MDAKRIIIGGVVTVYVVVTISLMVVLFQGTTCHSKYPSYPLLLISLDGFRADYLSWGLTPTLQALADRGVKVPYMKPSYPTLTFPNHYTIVTGLYPESHGIIANSFFDPVFNSSFTMSTNDSNNWWGGDPIWNTVTRQGKKSATYFWPGSDHYINGSYPDYWYPYDGRTSFTDRVDKVLEWLTSPSDSRPDFICFYFDEPDHVGHGSGPDSKEVNKQLENVDNMLKRLLAGMERENITPCVNMIVLADHGMATAGPRRVIHLPDYITDINNTAYTYTGAFSRINPKNNSEAVKTTMMEKLSCKRKEMRVYPREGLPTRFHFSNNRRIEDIVLDLDPGWTTNISFTYSLQGQHGYDSNFRTMNALFVAAGPDFKTQMEAEPFQNIELYNLMCHLTGVEPSANNGTLGSLYHILANPPPAPQLPTEEKPPTSLYPEDGNLNASLLISNCPGDFNTSQPWMKLLKLNEDQRNKTEAFHLPWGIPHSSPLPASLTLLHHQDHVTGYSQTLKMPLWTSFSVWQQFDNLTSNWSSDVRLNSTTTPTCDDYDQLATSNISMFPLFPPGFSWNTSVPQIPFLVSNAVPASKQLIKRWKVLLQELVPAWLALYGPLNLVLGPVFDNNADSLPDDFPVPDKFQNSSIPEVPSDLFAVVTRCKTYATSLDLCPPSNLDAAAFIIPMVEFVSNCQSDADYLVEFSAKVHDVELVTGLTFFPDLDFQPRTSLVLRILPQLWPVH